MVQITTHVLDLAHGKPAQGIGTTLYQGAGPDREEVGKGTTDADGRILEWCNGETLTDGIYSIVFASGRYFMDRGGDTFYPHVEIVFRVTESEAHYHVPLLLSPWGYSTYRGS